MKATPIKPTDSRRWPIQPLSVPRPGLTSDMARALYATRMADDEKRWADEEALRQERVRQASIRRTAWRKAKRTPPPTLDEQTEQRQDQAERED